MLKDRKAYERELDEQLAEWKADIDALKGKARRADAQAKADYDKAIDAMLKRHDEAGVHLHKLKSADDDTWADVKAATEKVWADIRSLFKTPAGKT